jgi:hypothetical protein
MSRSKRPSVIDTIDLTGEEPTGEVSNVVAMQGQGGEQAVKQPVKPKPRPDVHHTSIYVPKTAYRKIRDIATMGDRRPHDVIMEGVDLVLAKYGFPSVAELIKEKA